ncbi:MAG: hypothetical protein GX571_09120, partial [Lentisphaerae bacterium]|nr:hypothetical protein [Lentisphaerota bacterium]
DFLRKDGRIVLAVSAGLLALALHLLNLWLGNLNQDEGWYLYAALEQAAGRLPYRDFFFSPGPFMPRVYGLLAPLWAPLGVAGGRALTALLGLGGAGLAAWLAARGAPRGRRLACAVTAWLLTAGNVYHSYFTTIPKTYALASLLLLAGLAALWHPGGPRAAWRAGLGGLLLAGAACTRLSLGIALPVAGLFLLLHARRWKGAWLGFGLGGAAGLALLLGPVLVRAPDQFLFANFFHATRGTEGLLFAAGSVSRLIRNYLALAALALAALALHGWSGRDSRSPDTKAAPPGLGLALLIFASVFVVHLLSPFPYDDYQVPVMPLLALATAIVFWRTLPANGDAVIEGRRQRVLVAVLLAWAALGAGTSTLNEEWMIVGKDRFWVVKKTKPDLAVLRATAREIAARVPATEPLLTQDTYLAVEARRRVPPGFEMGPFSYFPGLNDEEALRYRVLNARRMKEALTSGRAPVVALSGYGLAIEAPVMTPVPAATAAAFLETLEQNYRLERTVRHFGQAHTPLRIWIRK